jgi:mono/diheme cytochrome c family protein
VKFRVKATFLLIALAGLAGCKSPLPAVDTRARNTFDAKVVARGAELAAIGNCRACHTRHGGPAYAGGFPMHSPFGTIYTTNITPDRETGIGDWSEAAFRRAMREGVRDDGQHLYPAFPYDRFRITTDEDIAAIYAFLMSLNPVRYMPPKNDITFPFNMRAGIAIWKRLYLKDVATPKERGAYLVEGLGHCGSCHSPRTKLMGEDLARVYDGGDAEGWHAYAINEKNAAPVPWDAPALAHYLRHGFHPQHGISRGTMGLVTHELREAAQEDIDAMAKYVAALMKEPSTARQARARELLRDPNVAVNSREGGAALYERVCVGCHRGRGALPWNGLSLRLSIGLTGESPRNLINVILHGLPPAPAGETAPSMPGYLGALDDAQVETLVAWMRANLTDQPPWKDVGKLIRESKRMNADMLLFPPGGTGTPP